MRPSFSLDKTHFVGVLLPPSLERKVEEKRMWARMRYGTKSGQSTRAHITLVPPFSSLSSTEEIRDILMGILALEKSFSTSVDGYGSFG